MSMSTGSEPALVTFPPIIQQGTWRLGAKAAPYVLVGPMLLLLAVFTVLPALLAAILSFYNVDILAGVSEFVGWKNFVDAYNRGEIANSLKVTFLYALMTVPTSLFFGLLAALAIHSLAWGRNFWRAVYFLPVAATLVAMSIVWRWMFLARKGLVDLTIGSWTGLTDWLNSSDLALAAVAVVGNWQQIGFVTVLYLAGLTGVPKHLHEAARIDGANAWHRFWNVTWPALGPTTVFATIISSIQALRVFDTISTMTAGGPSNSSTTLTYLLWQRGIYFFDIGGGAVVTLVLLVLALIATFVQMYTSRRLEAAGSR
jgi:multiple sugar transport system permease protein